MYIFRSCRAAERRVLSLKLFDYYSLNTVFTAGARANDGIWVLTDSCKCADFVDRYQLLPVAHRVPIIPCIEVYLPLALVIMLSLDFADYCTHTSLDVPLEDDGDSPRGPTPRFCFPAAPTVVIELPQALLISWDTAAIGGPSKFSRPQDQADDSSY